MNSLTKLQKAFLETYLPDVFDDKPELKDAKRADFAAAVVKFSFDGQISSGDRRIAKNLAKQGLFSLFELHNNAAGFCLHVQFSEKGANALFDLWVKG